MKFPHAFSTGDHVTERHGSEDRPPIREYRTQVVAVHGDVAETATGGLYDPFTGGRYPHGEGPYRAIRWTAPTPATKGTT